MQNTGNDGPASALAALQDYSSSGDSSPEEPGPWPKAPERFFLSPTSKAREIGPAVSDEQYAANLRRRLLELHDSPLPLMRTLNGAAVPLDATQAQETLKRHGTYLVANRSCGTCRNCVDCRGRCLAIRDDDGAVAVRAGAIAAGSQPPSSLPASSDEKTNRRVDYTCCGYRLDARFDANAGRRVQLIRDGGLFRRRRRHLTLSDPSPAPKVRFVPVHKQPCSPSRPPRTPHTPLDLATRAAMTSPSRRRLDARPLGDVGGRPQGRHLWPRRGVRGLEVSSSTATSRPPPPLPPPPPPPFCPSARLAPSTAPPLWSAGGGDCGRPRRGAVSPPAHRAPLRYYGLELWVASSGLLGVGKIKIQ